VHWKRKTDEDRKLNYIAGVPKVLLTFFPPVLEYDLIERVVIRRDPEPGRHAVEGQKSFPALRRRERAHSRQVQSKNQSKNPKLFLRRIELGENGSAFWGRTEEAFEARLRGMVGGDACFITSLKVAQELALFQGSTTFMLTPQGFWLVGMEDVAERDGLSIMWLDVSGCSIF